MKKTAPIYRQLLRDAWSVTWERKSLWVFGLLAGMISTGGVVDVAISGMRRAALAGSLFKNLLDQSFIGYAYASQFFLQLQKIDPREATGFFTVVVLVIIGLVCTGIISQAALIHGSGATHLPPYLLRRHVLPHFWNVLLIDLATKAISVMLIFVTSLPVFSFLLQRDGLSSSVLFLHFLIFIPTIIILHILSMLALVATVEKNQGVLASIEQAWDLFRRQWLATLEYGFLLFLIVLIGGLLLAAALTLGAIPYGALYALAATSGSIPLFFTINTLSALGVLILLFLFGSVAITFQYSAWRQFYKRAEHRTFGQRTFSKIRRTLFA